MSQTRLVSALSRRRFLGAGLAAGSAAALGSILPAGSAFAADPPAAPEAPKAPRHQASRVYPFTVGEASAVVVSDGYTRLAPLVPRVVTNGTEAEVNALLEAAFLPTTHVDAALNTLYLEIGGMRVLVDTGYGAANSQTGGKQIDSLKEAGIDPAAIDVLVITHAHPDHLWGYLDAAGKPNFPKAQVVVSEAEYNFWTNKANEIQAMAAVFENARKHLGGAGDRLRTVKPGEEIVAGLAGIDASGHTPGHLALHITSGGEELIVTADTANHAILFLEHPEWAFSFDLDPAKASETRRRLLDRLATDKTRMLGYHFPFPGIGRVRRKGSAFEFVAEPWSTA